MTNKQCHKVKFLREEDALSHIRRMRKKSNNSRQARPYLCPHCNVWHITSQINYKEVEELKKQLAEKTKELEKNLIAERKKERKEIKIDTRIIELTNSLTKHKRLITKLRKDNSELVTKFYQLNLKR